MTFRKVSPLIEMIAALLHIHTQDVMLQQDDAQLHCAILVL